MIDTINLNNHRAGSAKIPLMLFWVVAKNMLTLTVVRELVGTAAIMAEDQRHKDVNSASSLSEKDLWDADFAD